MSVNYSTRCPQYFSQMLQILWFETDEWSVICYVFFMAYKFGGLVWLLLPIVPTWYIRSKRKHGRGYFQHLLYQVGLASLDGYPTYFVRKFNE